MNEEQREQLIREIESANPLADAEIIAETYKTLVGPDKEPNWLPMDEPPF